MHTQDKTHDDFFPDGYKRPETGGRYMKFTQGENRFRILQKPIFGSVGWRETSDGRRPLRKRMGEDFTPGEVIIDAKNKVRHFWMMPVWNYAAGAVQVMEITQSTVQEAIEGLANNPKWGTPLSYDICVTKSGEGMDTSYATMPEPKTPLSKDILAAWAEVEPTFDIERAFTGDDPFDAPPRTAGGAPISIGMKRFFALLDEAIKVGIWDRSIKDKDDNARLMRRKIIKDALKADVEPTAMTEEQWSTVNNWLDSAVKSNRPGDDDIPF